MMCVRDEGKHPGKYFVFSFSERAQRVVILFSLTVSVIFIDLIDGALVAKSPWHQQPGQAGRVALMGGPVQVV